MSDLVRLSVNLNQETAAALRELAQTKGITYGEAIRRAISIYSFIDKEKQQGRKILLSDDKQYRELEIL
jgi:hypothetical protein